MFFLFQRIAVTMSLIPDTFKMDRDGNPIKGPTMDKLVERADRVYQRAMKLLRDQ